MDLLKIKRNILDLHSKFMIGSVYIILIMKMIKIIYKYLNKRLSQKRKILLIKKEKVKKLKVLNKKLVLEKILKIKMVGNLQKKKFSC